MKTDYDAVVIGAGVIGTMTARALAERGRSTLIVERYQLGHKGGSSHGLSRIVRVTDYHPDYVRINRLAMRGWEEVQEAAGETLLVRTGNLEIGEGAQIYADALDAAGERYAWLGPEEVGERWPSLRLRAEERMFVQEDGGVCLADRTVRAAARLASEAGAELREGTRVERVRDHDSFADVVIEGATIRSSVVVVTAGAWARNLLADAGMDLPLVPTLEQVSYYRLETASPLPTIIDYTVNGAIDHYAVPHPTELGSFKIALDHAGPIVDPDTRSFDPDPERLARVEAWGRSRFDSLIPTDPPETCLYTNTPDNDYVLDRIGSIVIGSACSGHGFKASPMIGTILADLATGSRPRVALGRFLASRPALR
ncbi:MAG: FAD-dependent oxidoreductase [Actinomycetota bacterium]